MNRVQPVGPVQAYRTFQVATPKSHTRPATCLEYGCLNYHNGFMIGVLNGDERRHFLIKTSGRPYQTEVHEGRTDYVFPPGTRCFAEPSHTVQVKPELYIVRGGDWRANLGLIRRHDNPDFWVEEFQEHTDKVSEALRKG